MARATRTTGLKALALIVALASLTINYGLIDLIDGYTGYIDQARNQVLDAGWGLVFGVILPLGLLSQLRRPERRIAGIQQTAAVGLVLALVGAAGEAWRYMALAAGIIAACAVLLALHPARRTFLARGQHSQQLRQFRRLSMPGGWPRRSGAIFRPPTPCRTACIIGR